MLTKEKEDKIIRTGLVLFWWFFWLFNVLDKIFLKTNYPLVGNERMAQFVMYLSSIGIHETSVAYWLLFIISLSEIIALVFFTLALISLSHGKTKKAHSSMFYAIFVSLIIFSFFAIADQIFEKYDYLFYHTLYWLAFVVSWFVYTKVECCEEKTKRPSILRTTRIHP